jgi:lipoate synthase
VVVVELAATPEYRFVATLKRDFMRVGVEDLEDSSGEIKVLGKILRKINEDDPPIGIEGLVPGFESIKGLMDLSSDAESEVDEEAIGYPAATLIPVGIWQ